MDKNHGYGEAWGNLEVSLIGEIIPMKLFRVKPVEDYKGKTFISEGVDANYYDIINYAVFALIKLSEIKHED
ncbi:Nucleotide modification associated domain 1 [anaerobic digester metagenome]